MVAPKLVVELVERFRDQLDSYTQAKYNETQARREFIDPFFRALGWDIDNTQGYSEAYKEVVHEDAIRVSGGHRAPDYSFRVGGNRKFFLESKKPSVRIKDEGSPAYQLRRYGWSAKLPLSVVTSFKELAVYDCRIKPLETDRPSVARVMFMTWEDYIERWDEIEKIFSKEAILKGSFDRFAEGNKLRRGTAEVDEDFLDELESWREQLAKNVALRNPSIGQAELNYVVQATIDRIVFLRIAEDRGTEEYGQLSKIGKTEDVYNKLFRLFKDADDRYNSGLFHFKPERNRPEAPDSISEHLNIDDRPLKEIIAALYYPQSPYEFSVIGADILGQVYEQFLGKVIRLTTGHRAVVDEKPEVKKAGGVYYTPTKIVDYIVRQTVGAVVDGKSIQQLRGMRILDPACGSGSFLIAAYQYLLDWYLTQYVSDPGKNRKVLYQGKAGEWRLTPQERKRILLAHIFGVDVDLQAVEVSKLSLLLKVLEGESAQTLQSQLQMFRERALPDLDANIKRGNSLVGPDYNSYRQLPLISADEEDSVHAFDWREEFPEILNEGGFDVILGNPPYVNAWVMFEHFPLVREYLNQSEEYKSADRHWDTYVLFIEKSMNLLRKNGLMSFIIPFSYCIQKYGSISRRTLVDQTSIVSIADLRKVRVFKNVPVITIIPVIAKRKPRPAHEIKICLPDPTFTNRDQGNIVVSHKIAQQVFRKSNEAMWRLDLDKTRLGICDTVTKMSRTVGDVALVNYGAQMSSKKKGGFGKAHVLRDKRTSNTCKKTIAGRDLYRYSIQWDGKYVEWALAPQMYGARTPWFFETPKIMVRDITGTHRLELSLDRNGFYCDHTSLCCLRFCDVEQHKSSDMSAVELSKKYSLEVLQGLLASRAVSAFYYWQLTGEGVRTGGGFHTYPNTIRALPLFDIEKASLKQKASLTRIGELASRLLDLHVKLSKAGASHTKRAIERQISGCDSQIDSLVYELYGFSPLEIKTIEAATA